MMPRKTGPILFGPHSLRDEDVILYPPLPEEGCRHLDWIGGVLPSGNGCRLCQNQNLTWQSLHICMTCGHVACGDDSPGHHARQHYEETGHPITMPYSPGVRQLWCYKHQRWMVDSSV